MRPAFRPPAWRTLALAAAALAGVAGGTTAALRDVATPTAATLGTPVHCRAYAGLPPQWGKNPHAGMVRVASGRVDLGSINGYAEEKPVRSASVEAFWMDRTEVTNAQFAAFVRATGYLTEAERRGEGMVFRAPPRGEPSPELGWWHLVRGANWRHPDGPQSSLEGRDHQPVVQVTRADAQAYAAWLGRALPTEAEWEYAAEAAGQAERVTRGPRDDQGRPSANFWQGVFPDIDAGEDGYAGRAPVGCYAANGLDLHDLIGNVWEWTSDPWSGSHQAHGTGIATSPDRAGARGLIKGGSFLCATDYCVRYRSSARHPQDLDVPASHIGFRTVARSP